MAKDRKEKKSAKKGFSNSPFKGLKLAAPKPAAPPAAPPPAARPPRARRPGVEDDEAAMFLAAVDGVERIADSRGLAPPPPPRPPAIIDEEAEAFARLAELVAVEGPFDITRTDDSIEGVAPGIDRRLLVSLRRGDFAAQDQLELQGMNHAQAKEAVEQFLIRSRRAGKRCVLLVHGRGPGSREQLVSLEDRLRVWLERGRIARAVLAFATARPDDGGAGALYVLLRR